MPLIACAKPRAGVEIGEAEGIAAPTTYGPDWSKLPIAERVAFVTPEIPDAPVPAPPRISRAPEARLRITSILWDASGQAMAAYEDEEGETGQLRPGDRMEGLTVTEITRSGVTMENARTGEVQKLELRPRTEKEKEEPRPRRGGRQRRPQGGFPAQPPG
jgi:hypothetical protein